jgi:hypothetical protein
MSTFNASTGLPTPANSPAPSAGTPAAASASAPAARSPSYVNSDVRRPRPRVSLRLVVVLALLAAPFLYFGYVILDQSLHGGVTNRGSYYEVDLKSLGYFPFDANKDGIDNVPAQWRQLDGKRVALQGEMYAATGAGDHVDAFELVYSIQKCCFNGPPRVQERVYATAGKNATVNYYPQIVRVVGTLHVTARRNEVGAIEKLYELDVESVDPA